MLWLLWLGYLVVKVTDVTHDAVVLELAHVRSLLLLEDRELQAQSVALKAVVKVIQRRQNMTKE